ncbi:hypothetical protein BESB_020170 [Besnoitia besnoiti]|uniref:Uncharacterized protein n=1 Tax=Besnoitia besnoiti TaxID=94643 RepID=A0A2A9M828_BESBE|nr:hypothetical protein BESB_020170 [Besnoitia besnoiti]PFH32076.1 hypothetical protein BESB_020170 [Besnoitia besnoiti]
MEARPAIKAPSRGEESVPHSSPVPGHCNVLPVVGQRAHIASQTSTTFVQAAVSADHQRGSKQMVTQSLSQSTHLCEMSSQLGGSRRTNTFSHMLDRQFNASCTTAMSPPPQTPSSSLRALPEAPEKSVLGASPLYPQTQVAPKSVNGAHVPNPAAAPLSGTSPHLKDDMDMADLPAIMQSKANMSNEAIVTSPPDLASAPAADVPLSSLPTPPENTLIILDYDDTLLPTNWAAVQNRVGLNDAVPPEMLPPLAELTELCIQTINMCLSKAMVVIVTNASVEWVNRSGEKFIPQVLRHIQSQGIEIISARDRLQSTGMAQRQWKIQVFEELINDVFGDRMREGTECTVISIGDGEGEREACLEMCRNLGVNEWLFKSLKLLAQPTCNQLISEHILVQQAFPEILKVPQSLDMAILDYKNCGGNDASAQPAAAQPMAQNANSQPVGASASPHSAPLQTASGFARPSAAVSPTQRKPPLYNGSGASSNGGATVVSVNGGRGGGAEAVPRGAALSGASATSLYPKNNVAATKSDVSPNTDAFVDLISDQLKAHHHDPVSTGAASLARKKAPFATAGGYAEKAKLLRR